MIQIGGVMMTSNGKEGVVNRFRGYEYDDDALKYIRETIEKLQTLPENQWDEELEKFEEEEREEIIKILKKGK